MADELIYPDKFRSLVQAAVAAHSCIASISRKRSWVAFEQELGLGADDLRKFRKPLTTKQLNQLGELGMSQALMGQAWAERLSCAMQTVVVSTAPVRAKRTMLQNRVPGRPGGPFTI
jgi:hypothetical protein